MVTKAELLRATPQTQVARRVAIQRARQEEIAARQPEIRRAEEVRTAIRQKVEALETRKRQLIAARKLARERGHTKDVHELGKDLNAVQAGLRTAEQYKKLSATHIVEKGQAISDINRAVREKRSVEAAEAFYEKRKEKYKGLKPEMVVGKRTTFVASAPKVLTPAELKIARKERAWKEYTKTRYQAMLEQKFTKEQEKAKAEGRAYFVPFDKTSAKEVAVAMEAGRGTYVTPTGTWVYTKEKPVYKEPKMVGWAAKLKASLEKAKVEFKESYLGKFQEKYKAPPVKEGETFKESIVGKYVWGLPLVGAPTVEIGKKVRAREAELLKRRAERIAPIIEKRGQELFESLFFKKVITKEVTAEEAIKQFEKTPEYKELQVQQQKLWGESTRFWESAKLVGLKAAKFVTPTTVGEAATTAGIIGGFAVAAPLFVTYPLVGTGVSLGLMAIETPKILDPTLPKERRIMAGITVGLAGTALAAGAISYLRKPVVLGRKYKFAVFKKGRPPTTYKPRVYQTIAKARVKGQPRLFMKAKQEFPAVYETRTTKWRQILRLKPKKVLVKKPSFYEFEGIYTPSKMYKGLYTLKKGRVIHPTAKVMKLYRATGVRGEAPFGKFIKGKIPYAKGKPAVGKLEVTYLGKGAKGVRFKPVVPLTEKEVTWAYTYGKIKPLEITRTVRLRGLAPGKVKVTWGVPGEYKGVFGVKVSKSYFPRAAGKVTMIRTGTPRAMPKAFWLKERIPGVEIPARKPYFLFEKKAQLFPPTVKPSPAITKLEYARPTLVPPGVEQIPVTRPELATQYFMPAISKAPAITVIEPSITPIYGVGITTAAGTRLVVTPTPALVTKVTPITREVTRVAPVTRVVPRVAPAVTPALRVTPIVAPVIAPVIVPIITPVVTPIVTPTPPVLPRVLTLPGLPPLPKKRIKLLEFKPVTRAAVGWRALVRRRGKFVAFGGVLPRGEAIRLGAGITRRTLAAAFKVVPTRIPVRARITPPFKPSPRIFRTYKIKKGRRVALKDMWIQKKRLRIHLPGEVTEIQRARRKKRRFSIL